MRVKKLVEPPVSKVEDERTMLADAAEAAEAIGAERIPTVVEVVAHPDHETPMVDS